MPARPPARARPYISGKAAEKSGRALRETLLRHANVSDQAHIALEGAELIVREGEAVRRIALADLAVDENGFVFAAMESLRIRRQNAG